MGATRKRLFFTGIITLVPVLILVLLAEGFLRAVGFGYPTSPMLRVTSGDEIVWAGNPDFTRLYFPAALKRLPPPNRIPVAKKPMTRRYLVVGGSAVAGDPDSDFSIPRILEWILSQSHPEMAWEVINLAYTASNSHVAREVVRQSGRYDLDGIIVLVGNNEVIGPFGPGTTLSRSLSSLRRRDAQVAIRKTKVGQAGQILAERLQRQSGEDDRWRGMEHFVEHRIAVGDPRLQLVYERFEANLADIGRIAAKRGLTAMLSTVPVNLLDQPPFYDDPRYLPEEIREHVVHYMTTGEFTVPPGEIHSAAENHPDSAYIHYVAGRLLFSAGDRTRAGQHLRRAVDLDQLRFRADSRINAIIRQQWARPHSPWIPLDAEKPLLADHPRNALGFPHFYEHVHFSFRANFLIAREMAIALLGDAGLPADTIGGLDWSEAAAGLGYTAYDVWLLLGETLRRFQHPPFTGIPGFDRQTAWMNALRGDLERRVALAEEKQRTYEAYLSAIRARPSDDRLKMRLARFLAASGQPEAAYDIVVDLSPRHPLDGEVAQTLLRLSVSLGNYESALAALERIQKIHPEILEISGYREEVEALRARQ